jgi:hypothetical protein
MHPRDLDRLYGWEFDGILARVQAQEKADEEARRQAAFSITEVVN